MCQSVHMQEEIVLAQKYHRLGTGVIPVFDMGEGRAKKFTDLLKDTE